MFDVGAAAAASMAPIKIDYANDGKTGANLFASVDNPNAISTKELVNPLGSIGNLKNEMNEAEAYHS